MVKDGLLQGLSDGLLESVLINYVSEYEPKNFCFTFPRYLMELLSLISIHWDKLNTVLTSTNTPCSFVIYDYYRL